MRRMLTIAVAMMCAAVMLAEAKPVQDSRDKTVRITDRWLVVDCPCNGWDDETGCKVFVDGALQYSVSEAIGGGRNSVHAFDVGDFIDSTARVVAFAAGTWENAIIRSVEVVKEPPAGAIRHETVVDECEAVDIRLKRKTGDHFLYVPIARGASPVYVRIYDGEKIVFDLRLRLATEGKADFRASIPLDGFRAGQLRLRTEAAVLPSVRKAAFAAEFSLGAKPLAGDPGIVKPKLHFSAPFGGSGDMVGFFRIGGEYHMGYLHDYGYDTWIENCCWSHAVSGDFFAWRPAAPFDRKGTGTKRSSGCCFVDERNVSGLGAGMTPPVLLFGCLENQYSQRWQWPNGSKETKPEKRPEMKPVMGLMVSRDGGKRFAAVKKPLFTMQAIGGHDPEVVFDKASGNFVMVVHDRRNGEWGFDFYVSKDLMSWEYASTVPGMWETPNFYPLELEGKIYWVLQECELKYLLGEFDGRVFKPLGGKLESFRGAFAPRTFLTEDGRRVLMAARRNAGPTGGATLPMEVKLVKTPEGPRLAYQPVKEFAKYASQVSDEIRKIDGEEWEMNGIKGKFISGEPHEVRVITDGPVVEYFVGWGVNAGVFR